MANLERHGGVPISPDAVLRPATLHGIGYGVGALKHERGVRRAPRVTRWGL